MVGLLIMICSFNFVEGLLFLQDQTDISESYTAEQTTVITLLNDQPRSQNIFIQIAPASKYLLNYIDIGDPTLTLIPGEKKNVLINTEFPKELLSPETHTIEIIARTDDDKSIAKTKITFTVPGIARPSLELIDEKFNLEGAEKTITIELENTGNVIMRPRPEIIIVKGTEIIKTTTYKTPIQIMPERTYPITLRVDTSSIKEGDYKVHVLFFERDGIEISTQEYLFKVKEKYENQKKEINFIMPALIGGILTILIIATIIVNKELKNKDDPLTKKLKLLEKREKLLTKELETLIKETHQTIHISNKWIRKNMGEEYELR